MRYKDYKCDGCSKVFTDEDDIVVCPECATPQHRECYNEKGGCVNAHLHSEDFQWQGEKDASAVAAAPVEEKALPVVEEPVEEPVAVPVVLMEEVNEEDLAEAMAQPDVELEEISFIPDDDDQFEVAPEEPGIEVVGVVWPERKNRNKVYRYDPNGEQLDEGDIVLVPTRDVAKGRDVIRKVAVAHANHRVDPEHIRHPLKKIIAVVKRRVSDSLTPDANEAARSTSKTKRRK